MHVVREMETGTEALPPTILRSDFSLFSIMMHFLDIRVETFEKSASTPHNGNASDPSVDKQYRWVRKRTLLHKSYRWRLIIRTHIGNEREKNNRRACHHRSSIVIIVVGCERYSKNESDDEDLGSTTTDFWKIQIELQRTSVWLSDWRTDHTTCIRGILFEGQAEWPAGVRRMANAPHSNNTPLVRTPLIVLLLGPAIAKLRKRQIPQNLKSDSSYRRTDVASEMEMDAVLIHCIHHANKISSSLAERSMLQWSIERPFGPSYRICVSEVEEGLVMHTVW